MGMIRALLVFPVLCAFAFLLLIVLLLPLRSYCEGVERDDNPSELQYAYISILTLTLISLLSLFFPGMCTLLRLLLRFLCVMGFSRLLSRHVYILQRAALLAFAPSSVQVRTHQRR